ncbi:MAG: type IV secretion system protein [Deltaproteobacteria bacterium]|nr:type IV secretion system protein [Deltaproteobacteria bacterium]
MVNKNLSLHILAININVLLTKVDFLLFKYNFYLYKIMKKYILIPTFVFIYIFVNESLVYALNGTFIDQTFVSLNNAMSGVKGVLRETALGLFKLTLTLEIGLFGIRIVLKKAQLTETIGEFCSLCIFAGFIASVILNYEDWTTQVFNGLGKLGGFPNMAPGKPLNAASMLVDYLLFYAADLTGIDNLIPAFMLMITAGIILVVFVIISCLLLMLQLEFLILGNAGIILVGLGGSKIFKDYAINMMKYIFSLGMKFFVLNLIINITLQYFINLQINNQLSSNAAGMYGTLLVAIAVALMLAFLSYAIPGMINGILQGVQISGGSPIGHVAGLAASGFVSRTSSASQSAAKGTVAAASAGIEAYKTAGAQGKTVLSRVTQAVHNVSEARSNVIANQQNTVKGQLRSMGNFAKAQKQLTSGGGTLGGSSGGGTLGGGSKGGGSGGGTLGGGSGSGSGGGGSKGGGSGGGP